MDKGTAAVLAIALLVVGIVVVAAVWYMLAAQTQAALPYAYGVGVPALTCSLSDRWNWSDQGHFEVNVSRTVLANTSLSNTLTVKNVGTGPTQNQVNVRATLARYPTNGDDDIDIVLTPGSGVYANKISDALYVLQQLGTSSYTGLYVGYSAAFDVDIDIDTSAPEGTYVVAFSADTLYTPLTYSYYSTQAVSQCGSSMVIRVVH